MSDVKRWRYGYTKGMVEIPGPEPLDYVEGRDYDEIKARLAEVIAAVDAWKRGDNDAGGCIAECERAARAADSAREVQK